MLLVLLQSFFCFWGQLTVLFNVNDWKSDKINYSHLSSMPETEKISYFKQVLKLSARLDALENDSCRDHIH